MDIIKVGEKSLRIKSKNTSFIINPEKKIEENVIVLMEKPEDYSELPKDTLIIAGPGEYEIAGVSIKGEGSKEGISYDFFEDGQRLIVLSNPGVAAAKDMEVASAVVVFLNGENLDKLSLITADTLAVVGDIENLPDKKDVKKIDKINLKKTEEYKGFLIHLAKN